MGSNHIISPKETYGLITHKEFLAYLFSFTEEVGLTEDFKRLTVG